MSFIDTHCHLDILSDDEAIINTILNNAKKNCIFTIINVSVSFQQFLNSLQVIPHQDGIYYTLGVSPNDICNTVSFKDINNFWNNINTFCIKNSIFFDMKKIIAIGEIGLDYFHMHSTKEMQKNVFETQLDFAFQRKLPVVLHIRNAFDDAFRILSNYQDQNIVFHCYSGDKKTTEHILSHYSKAFFSFAGNITYPNAHKLHESLSIIPIEKILLETDAPYLSPIPSRGKKNEPSYIVHTYDYVAGYKNIPMAHFCKIIVQNVENAFKIKIQT